MGFEANARTREREKREGRVSEEAEPREAGGEKIPARIAARSAADKPSPAQVF